jgi:rubredoxin---NAD+ reductase
MPYRQFTCHVCSHIYDEAVGDPDSGIAPGTRWDDIPDTWACPECGVTKADFALAAA